MQTTTKNGIATKASAKADIFTNLAKPFDHKWRVGRVYKESGSCLCLPYIDARDVMNRLDEVMGAENWQDDYKQLGDEKYCGLALRIKGEWVWKWDTGTSGNFEKEKSQASDSFKRAAVKFGIGRYLYALPSKTLKAQNFPNSYSSDNWHPVTLGKTPRKLNTSDKLTEYLNRGIYKADLFDAKCMRDYAKYMQAEYDRGVTECEMLYRIAGAHKHVSADVILKMLKDHAA